jgi:NAD dependent epimerase/dehydratase
MKAVVTGAGGFIGSHLVHRLVAEGFHVRAFIHYNSRSDWGQLEFLPTDILQEIEVVAGDIQDPFTVRKAIAHTELVFHLSSFIAIPYSYIAPQSYISTNISGALNVMQACLAENVAKVVHTSTSECYGTARYVPIDENHPIQGQSPYSASKIGADMVAESFFRSFNLPVATLRPFNTYGPRQSARAIIPTIISQALTGAVIHLGALNPTRDLNFIDDTVSAFMKIALTPGTEGEVINAGSGKEISVGELARLILELMEIDRPIETDSQRIRPSKSEVTRLLCDNTKAKKLLGWEPAVPLRNGLSQTIDWFTSNSSRYKSKTYNI